MLRPKGRAKKPTFRRHTDPILTVEGGSCRSGQYFFGGCTRIIKILPRNSGAYGHPCCGHSIQSDFSKSHLHETKKAMYSSSKHCFIGTELDCQGQYKNVEKRWRDFFADPSKWWDNRPEKDNPRFPDFKQKETQESLWLNSKFNPPWVESELAAMAPGIVHADIVTWNKRLRRYVKAGNFEMALDLFQQMQEEGISPDKFTFVPVLKACSHLQALQQGRQIHEQILKSGHQYDVYVGSCLTGMYARCGRTEDAWMAFNQIQTHNVVSWSTMILGFVKCGEGRKALELFWQMSGKGVEPNTITFVGVLNACASLGALEEGKRIHEHITERGFESHTFVSNSLIDMYVKCGSIGEALSVFKNMPERDVVAWSVMILGLVKCGDGQQALKLFWNMCGEWLEPNSLTFVGALSACASMGALEEGRQVHLKIVTKGCESDSFVGNSLVDMYAKCGSIGEAWDVFSKMPRRDVVGWSALILGYVKCGEGQKAMELFQQMCREEVEPNTVTFVGSVNACASVGALEDGRYFHEQITQRGFESDVFVGNSLIDMYAKCGKIEDAKAVFNKMPFHDVVSWNSLLGGYAMHGHGEEARSLFEQMCQKGLNINGVTFISLLSACSHGGLVDEGLFHFQSMTAVHGLSATLRHYACIIDILGRAGRLHEADDLLKTISDCEPNALVLIPLLGACKTHDNLEIGEHLAKQLLKLDNKSAAGFVLLSNIYVASQKLDRNSNFDQQRLQQHTKQQPGSSWIEVNNKIHFFTADDSNHAQIDKIHAELERLYGLWNETGCRPDNFFLSHNVDKGRKEHSFCHHSERLALAFGLISTVPGSPLQVFKDMQMCGDCHMTLKFFTNIVGREITIRDANRFHHFENGFCSCKDYW